MGDLPPVWIGRLDTTYDLNPEREVMNRIIQKKLGAEFTMLPLSDSCYHSMKLDTASRRRSDFLPAVCKKCGIKYPIFFLDAEWWYLDQDVMNWLDRSWRSGITSNPWLVGTWWIIYANVYSPLTNTYLTRYNEIFSQFNNKMPLKWWPGYSHIRFFKRPVREIRKVLVATKR